MTSHSRSGRLALALLAAAATAVPWASSCSPAAPTKARRAILITCDTLRADRLGVYGYERGTSPNVDRFASTGVVFTRAFASAPWTRPALSSVMTGRHPEEVGAAPGNLRMLPASVETLAERVRAHGIATAAVVSNGLIQRPPAQAGDVDLAQGFDVYDDTMTGREQNRDMPERGARDTTDAALAWLDRHRDEGDAPFFLWVHYQDPHGPYTPPAELSARYDRPIPADEAALPLGSTMRGWRQIPFYQVLPDATGQAPEPHPTRYRDRYDAEIAYFDRELGRLLARLESAPWYDDALVVLSADHGESLGEHEYWFCHGENVQFDEVHIPWIVRAPRGLSLPAGRAHDGVRAVDAPVGQIDLWPTVLSALGLPMDGARGISLLAERLPERVLLQSFVPQRADRAAWAASDGRFRLTLAADGSSKLCDLDDDPGEERDVASAHPDVARRLLEEAQALRAVRLGAGTDVHLDENVTKQLQALGYADNKEGEAAENVEPPR